MYNTHVPQHLYSCTYHQPNNEFSQRLIPTYLLGYNVGGGGGGGLRRRATARNEMKGHVREGIEIGGGEGVTEGSFEGISVYGY